jgi:fermentation-respiration switch protein FrsA (DUF1100 family)
MLRALPIILVLGVVAIAYLAVMFSAQRGIIFQPPMARTASVPADARSVEFSGRGGRIEAWFLRPTTGGTGPAPLLLFTHGNSELIDDFADQFAAPRAAGYSVLLVEYPGYGRSEGTASEASIRDAILVAYDWARTAPEVDATRIVPYGRSLGGGAACLLADSRPVAALILESSFTSVRALARRLWVPGFLIRDPFDSLKALRSYRGPLLVLHGNRDDVIPVEHGRQLAAAVPGAEFELLTCGHNDCPRSWERILSFLSKSLALAKSSSPPR